MNARMFRMLMILLAVCGGVLFFNTASWALDPLVVQDVNISCGPIAIDKDTVTTLYKDTVVFKMNIPSCDSVKINGVLPIGTFKLTDAASAETVTFVGYSAGNYNYTAKAFPGGDSLSGRLVKVSAPFLGTWGIVVLLLLLAGTAWFVLSRRKVRPTGSAA